MERLPTALVFDRDGSVRDLIRNALEARGIMTLGAESCAEAVEMLSGREVELLFVDLEAPPPPLAGVLARAGALTPKPLVIGLVSSEEESERSQNMDAGIFDLLGKPLREGLLSYRIERGLRQLELLAATQRLRRELQNSEGMRGLVGRSAPMSRLRERIERLSASDATVWFCGEAGSGKELAARTMHTYSRLAAQQFRVIDCAAGDLSELESVCSAPHQLAAGTIYLAEAAGLPLALQQSLLVMLSALPRDGVNGMSLPSPGPRILAGSLHDPRRTELEGGLLPALHQRLTEATLHMPPLRERAADIALLAHHFVSTIRRINQLPPIRIEEEALVLLEAYSWPGNVRELRNTMEKAVILAVEGTIRKHDLPRAIREQSDQAAAGAGSLSERQFKEAKQEIVAAFESAYLSALMQRFSGNVTSAARHAGMLRSALQRLLRKQGFKSVAFRHSRTATARRQEAENALE